MKRGRRIQLGLVMVGLLAGCLAPAMSRGGATVARQDAITPAVTLTFTAFLSPANEIDPASLVITAADKPEQVVERKPITGLAPGEKLNAIDFNSIAKALNGVGNLGGVYTIDPSTGIAAKLGDISSFFTNPNVGFDHDPINNILRSLNNEAEANVVINASTGQLQAIQPSLRYIPTDPNKNSLPALSGLAYRDNRPAQNSTTLFGIDSKLGILVKLNDPASGDVTTVGSLGVTTTDRVGFDIAADGQAYASLTSPNNPTTSRLFKINLDTGVATALGTILARGPVDGLAVLSDSSNTIQCEISPGDAVNPVGTTHTFTVELRKNGQPLAGKRIIGSVVSGPNAVRGFDGITMDDPNTVETEGEITFQYASNGKAGTDFILFGGIVDGFIFLCSANKTWELPLLKLNEVVRDGKKLNGRGCCFQSGDVMVLNGEEFSTKRGADDPNSWLVKKGGRRLQPCQGTFFNNVFVKRETAPGEFTQTSTRRICP